MIIIVSQSIFTALKFSVLPLFIHPLTPQPLVTTDLFIVSVVLPSPECHMIRIIQYVAFSDWLLSLSSMYLSLLYVFLWLDSSLLFSTEGYSIVWMYHSLFIHSPTEGQLDHFQIWAIMNKAAINIRERVFVGM